MSFYPGKLLVHSFKFCEDNDCDDREIVICLGRDPELLDGWWLLTSTSKDCRITAAPELFMVGWYVAL